VDHAELTVPQLTCTIGNNAAHGDHRAGYNGIFAMRAPDEPESPFVPLYAGWNLEHYFDQHPTPDNRDRLFEPRLAPMEFAQNREDQVTLYQPQTPHYGVESWTEFTLREPYYIDVAYRCTPHKQVFAGGFLGVFWASYINAPLDKSMYLLEAGASLDAPLWAQHCTPRHGHDSTVRHEQDAFEGEFAPKGSILFASYTPLRYSVPFFYGRFRDMVLIYVFQSPHLVRLAHSPSGGGKTPDGTSTNPAWDFQLIVPGYKAGETYTLRSRVIYKPWIDRPDVLRELRAALDHMDAA
jgi:hypothetical protein